MTSGADEGSLVEGQADVGGELGFATGQLVQEIAASCSQGQWIASSSFFPSRLFFPIPFVTRF